MTASAQRAVISGQTRVAAVIGHPVRHSLSPRIHNAGFAAAGLDWTFVALDVAPGNGQHAVEAMRSLGIDGLSVTMPHKESAAKGADRRTPAVERLEAANCLYWHNEEIWADSTDGDGFVAAFEQHFGQTMADRDVAVIGAGGAARSIIEALGRHDAGSIVVLNRSQERLRSALSLADRARAGTAADLAEVEIIVNASPVGMTGGPAPDDLPLDIEVIGPSHTVVDIVYSPIRTPLLVAAEERGARTQGGVAMLVHQAALAFSRWTNRPPPTNAMAAAVADHLV